MLQRHVATELLEALRDSPVVLLHGARQSGKTTLVRSVAASDHPARYLTLDDATILAAAHGNPDGFVAGLDGPVALDEIQRAPDLLRAIKASVDRDRRPGRFLLTGSTNVLLLPRLSESLAGRMEIVTLWPFSQGEIEGERERFVDALFSRRLRFDPGTPPRDPDLFDRIFRGGYPEVIGRATDVRRRAWFGSYLSTILQRDVRDIADIEDLSALPRLLALLASRAGGLFNLSDVSRGLGIPQTTLKRYFALLEATFLVRMLPPWSSRLGLRLVRTPKLYLGDTGMLAYLLGADRARLVHDAGLAGPLVENFVVMELTKQAAWSRTRPQIFHYRTQTGHEVDIVLEDRAGRLAGIEVKAGGSAAAEDFKGLRRLAEAAGRKFVRGVVLYAGREVVPFGANLHALPLHALWRGVPAAGAGRGPVSR